MRATTIMDERGQRTTEQARRVINNLTAAKATAQVLERRASALPDGEREQWMERLRAIVTAVNMAAIEVGLLADEAAARSLHD